nr:EKC/KEOPS complex subunit LAGE3 isoform X3 [Desmodus rotundus]
MAAAPGGVQVRRRLYPLELRVLREHRMPQPQGGTERRQSRHCPWIPGPRCGTPPRRNSEGVHSDRQRPSRLLES